MSFAGGWFSGFYMEGPGYLPLHVVSRRPMKTSFTGKYVSTNWGSSVDLFKDEFGSMVCYLIKHLWGACDKMSPGLCAYRKICQWL